MQKTLRPHGTQHPGSFLCSYDQKCQHFQKGISLETLNSIFSRSRNPLWYNCPVRAQTHVNLVRWSRTPPNPTLGQFILHGSIRFVLINMQEWVHFARNFSYHVKNCQNLHWGSFYFVWSLPFPSPLVDWSLSDWIGKPIRIWRDASATNITHVAALWKAISRIIHVSLT